MSDNGWDLSLGRLNDVEAELVREIRYSIEQELCAEKSRHPAG